MMTISFHISKSTSTSKFPSPSSILQLKSFASRTTSTTTAIGSNTKPLQQKYTQRKLYSNNNSVGTSVDSRGGNVYNTKRFGHNLKALKADCDGNQASILGNYIIHWRGEGTKGYSLQFRHLEFINAYHAVSSQQQMNKDDKMNKAISQQHNDKDKASFDVEFQFQFDDATPTVDEMDDSFGAMQYIQLAGSNDHYLSDAVSSTAATATATNNDNENENNRPPFAMIDQDILLQSAKRCSLIRHIYQIVGEGDTYEELAISTINQNMLTDMMQTPSSSSSSPSLPSWSLRLREYSSLTDNAKRYGIRKRSSMSKEKEAVIAMSALLLNKFTGPVNLRKPDCPLHILQGLTKQSCGIHNNNDSNQSGNDNDSKEFILVRGSATGPRTSIISPNSRKCITRTPLCPIAAFLICNLARVKDGDNILDPFAGSCTTLLAATMMAKNIKAVGVEIADDSVVNRNNIKKDFESRGLNIPRSLIKGDITIESIRDEARDAIQVDNNGGELFDVILADPPYGIREAMGDGGGGSSNTNVDPDHYTPPLVRLIECIAEDRANGKPLLRKGGRLVAFVPARSDENVQDGIPNNNLLLKAGLEFIDMKQQPLSDVLSRWLVIYRCTFE